MSANEGGLGSNDTAQMSRGASASKRRSPELSTTQPLANCVIAAAGAITALLVVHSVISQLGSPQNADTGRAISAAGLAGAGVSIFSYYTIRLFNLLTETDLNKILGGDKLTSARWASLAMLGIMIGGSVALFHALAVAMLPQLAAFLAH